MEFTGGPALRQTTTSQDGFPGAFGIYAWRLRDNSSVEWTGTYTAALGANEFFSEFGFLVRRWDGSPSPNFLVEYSFDGGSTYSVATSIGNGGVIDNSALGDTSDWSTFTQAVSSPNGLASGDFIVRISAQGSTERIMIDEFFYTISTGPSPICNLASSGLANLTCDDNGTPSDPTDDRFSFSLEPNGSNLGTSYTVTGANVTPSGGNYSIPTFFLTDPGTAGAGDLTITIVDDSDPNCTFPETLTDPGTCSSQCSLTDAGLANIQCNSNGTPNDPNDDFLTFELDPTGFNLGPNYTVTGGPVSPGGANYGSPTTFTTTAGTAGAGNLLLTITDASGGGCTLPVTVTDPGACSVPNTVYSQSSGSWTGSGIWNSLPDGTGTSVTNPDNTGISVIVQPGHTIEMAAGAPSVNTLEVQAGGAVIAGGGTNEYIQVYGGSVVVDGAMGAVGDGMSLDINGPACTISGAGSIQLSRLRKDNDGSGAGTTNLVIATSMALTWSSSAALYNNGTPSQSPPANFNVTINPGVTVTVTGGDIAIDGIDGSNTSENAGTFTINGTLDIQQGDLYVRTDNSSTDINYVINGEVIVGGQVIGNSGNAGSGTANLDNNGLLRLTGLGTVFTSLSGRDAFSFNTGSTAQYDGPGDQTIESSFDYYNLTVSNAGDKSLNGTTELTGTLTFSNARVDANATYLYVNNSNQAAITGQSQDGYLFDGFLRQRVTTNEFYTLPVGSQAPQDYQPVNITFSSVAGIVDVEARFEQATPAININDNGQVYTQLLDHGIWEIRPAVPGNFGGSYDLTLNARNYSNYIPPCAAIKTENGSWIASPTGTAGSCSESNNTVIATRTGITTFSEFGIGISAAPLPITLHTFTARPEGSTAQLHWRTATELHNDYMAVEHSTDGRRYREIGRVAGAGTTQVPQEYRFKHESPAPGLNYYRLRQVDYDGQYEYHGPVSVRFSSASASLSLYPNPAGSSLTLDFQTKQQREGEFLLLDAYGRQLQRIPHTGGPLRQNIDLTELPAGAYTLLWRGRGEVPVAARFVRE